MSHAFESDLYDFDVRLVDPGNVAAIKPNMIDTGDGHLGTTLNTFDVR